MTGTDLWKTLGQTPLFLDQTDTLLEVAREEIAEYYAPLAVAALGAVRPGRREIVAVAGPPGSGKSAFATALTAVINAMAGMEAAALVGLDGWHYPNEYLDNHAIERAGEAVPLRRIKGAPETYDQDGIRAFLSRAGAARRLAYPLYSRELHDPIPGAGAIGNGQRIVVLEGNYWLLDEAPWNSYWRLFDLRIFLTAEPGDLLPGLRQRHLRGGKDPDFVEQHLLINDVPNIERVLGHSGPADVLVRKADSRRITGIEWLTPRDH
jgi:putative kinase